ncbi:hypothetical protein LZL87_005897 [Fusarium oxysporum]|nr:hypothetical protein LZL87_005897 [Fusarium oxysporum]
MAQPVVKGVKDARFESSVTDWDGKYHNLIGTSTRQIYFGYESVLTDGHIDDILVLSRQVREKIWQFIFNFSDVSYTAKNGTRDLTNEAVIRLAKGLPNLRTVSLPSANQVGDAGCLGLISNCPDLRLLEITPSSTNSYGLIKISAKALDEFCAHPEWAPGLKQLIVTNDENNKEFMKSMRALSKQREKLVVTLLHRREEQIWGDFEIVTTPEHFVKGRKGSPEKTPRGIAQRYGQDHSIQYLLSERSYRKMKMGTFERGQRYTGLTKQCQSYYEQHKMHATACEARAKELFKAVTAITAAQGKTWDHVFGLSGDFSNIIFDGGFEYRGPESVGKSLSFAQWFFLASLIGLGHDFAGAPALLYYVGCTLGIAADSYPVNVRMPVASLFRLARDPGSHQTSRGLPWARLSQFFRPSSGNYNVTIIGLELFSGELPYEDSTRTIHDLAAMRLDACAHSIMMKAIFDGISKLTSKAIKSAEDPSAATSFDISKEFGTIIESLIKAFDNVADQALEWTGDYDRIYQKQYMGDDPDLTNHAFELRKAAPSNIIRFDVSYDFAVDSLHAETEAYDGIRFGGFGRNKKSIFLDDDEAITGASWNTGVLAEDATKKVIFNLIINTTERKLGPFGTGGDKVKSNAEKQIFKVPERMKVYGLVDSAGKYIEHRGDVIMESGRLITELRFIVGPAE